MEMYAESLSFLALYVTIKFILEAFLEQAEQSRNNKICILPWVHQFGTLSGSYGLCCFSEYLGTFGEGKSPLEAFNDDYMKSTRLAMLAGEEVSPCKVCYDWERSGVESPRQRMNKRFFKYTRLYDQTADDGSVKNPPIYIDFRFGNLCNFTCRMCGAISSSSWAREAKKHGYLEESAPNHYDHWTNNELFWKDIDKFKKYIKVIYFAGGEPFVQEGHYKLLEFLVKNECTDIELNYNTNLSYQRSLKSYDIEELWSNLCILGVNIFSSLLTSNAQPSFPRIFSNSENSSTSAEAIRCTYFDQNWIGKHDAGCC